MQLTFEIICTPLKMEPHYSIIFSHLITTPAVSMMLGVRCYYPLMHMHGFIGRELLILWFLYIYNKVRVLQIRKYASKIDETMLVPMHTEYIPVLHFYP